MTRTATAIALVLGLLAPAPALANLMYSETPCGGDGQPFCTVVQSYQPAINAAPLTQQAFNAFYQAHGYPYTATYDYTPVGSSADYEFGLVSNTFDGMFHTFYLNGPAGLICCTADVPWRIIGINAAGMLIGFDGLFPFISDVTNANGFSALEIPFTVLGHSLLDFGIFNSFIALDDAGNILGRGRDGWYELNPVPEPASVTLMLAGLAVLGWRRRFRDA